MKLELTVLEKGPQKIVFDAPSLASIRVLPFESVQGTAAANFHRFSVWSIGKWGSQTDIGGPAGLMRAGQPFDAALVLTRCLARW